MNLELTLEQKMIQKMVREFTENEVKPIAAETDRTAQYPAETIDQLFRYGIMGMCVPKELTCFLQRLQSKSSPSTAHRPATS